MGKVMIHKYGFDLSDEVVIMVNGTLRRLLSIQKQNGIWCAWAEVDMNGARTELVLEVVGTGHPVPQHPFQSHYIATVQDGPYVWHFFQSRWS